ncbi:MAG: hypothetical protein FWH04_02025 [Oscillospiraceae bacterium]|nr:hypothetical protein [Oscillospiraceae bacterium]
MRNTTKMLIMGSNDGFATMIEEHLASDSRIEFLGSAHNGREACEKINSLRPDVLMIDIKLPMDDIAEVKYACQTNPGVNGFIVSGYSGGDSPCADTNIEKRITAFIHDLGIPPNIKGYHYIRKAIAIAMEDSRIMHSITNELYPIVAEIFNTTPLRVERAIRHAIEVAWGRCDMKILQEVFGHTIRINKSRPTNSEFIAMIADCLLMRKLG